MSTAGGNFETPKQAIGGKTIRSIREASIDVAAGDTVVGLHRTEFTDAYYFHCCGDPAISPFQGLSLIHGNVGSKPVRQRVDEYPAWFNAADMASTDRPNETSRNVNSPPDIAGQVISIPLHGANKLSFGFSVWDSVSQVSDFVLTLYSSTARWPRLQSQKFQYHWRRCLRQKLAGPCQWW